MQYIGGMCRWWENVPRRRHFKSAEAIQLASSSQLPIPLFRGIHNTAPAGKESSPNELVIDCRFTRLGPAGLAKRYSVAGVKNDNAGHGICEAAFRCDLTF